MYRSWKAPCFILTALWDGFITTMHKHAQPDARSWSVPCQSGIMMDGYLSRSQKLRMVHGDSRWCCFAVVCLHFLGFPEIWKKQQLFLSLKHLPHTENTRFSIFFSRWFGLLNGSSHYGQPPAQSPKSQVTSSWNGANAFPQSMDGPEL